MHGYQVTFHCMVASLMLLALHHFEMILIFCRSTFRSAEIQNTITSRAYPGSEFVVANNLAKLKKLEPNEINFSQGFSQKVSTCCFVYNY